MNKNSHAQETRMAGLFHPSQILKAARPDYLCDLDLTNDELYYLLDLAAAVKQSPREYGQAMAGKSIAMLFEKPSLRTKLTFDLAMSQMGGDSVFVEGPIFAQSTVEGLAEWSSVPVINALSDAFHPCQALADVLTIRERFGTLKGLKLTFIGDGNNVAQSLMLTAVRLGMDFALGCPPGYTPDPDIVSQAEGLAAVSGASVRITHDAAEALGGAHAVYTDVWASMGQEQEAAKRKKAFHAYQVNEELFAQARPDAVFMHCLPAKRGEEVTDPVIESPRSVVFQEAENRLHAQKALLLMMLT
jgi:ornithine carbamoyltransferase